MGFIDLRAKATEQEIVRREAFRIFLKGLREHQQAEAGEINSLLEKVGERNREEAKATMEKQVGDAMQKAKAVVEESYIEQHELAGMDEHTRSRYKKLLNGLVG